MAKQNTPRVKVVKWWVKNRNLLDPREVKPKRIVRPTNSMKWGASRYGDQSRY